MSTTTPAAAATGGAPTVPQLINNIWLWISAQVKAGATDQVKLPMAFRSIIGQQGLDDLTNRFKNLIKAPVTTVDSVQNDTIHIVPVKTIYKWAETAMQNDEPTDETIDKTSKIRRPPNAFILYRQHYHPIVKAQNPALHNNQISVILGAQWRNEKDEVKKQYQKKAADIKKQHGIDHPNYSYKPRKPAERKRRMTQKKAATLSKMSDALPIQYFQASSSETPGTAAANSPKVTLFTMLNNEPKDFFNPPQEIEFNEAGNAIFPLGDTNTSDEDFRMMLDDYNKAMPVPPDDLPAFTGMEPTTEGTENLSFYNTDFDLNLDSLVEAQEMGYGDCSLEQSIASWDQLNPDFYDAEMNRFDLSADLGDFSM